MRALDADLANYFTDFGVDATVGGVPCRGLFDEAYAESFGIVAGASPALLVAADIAAVEDAAVIIGARSFVVTAIEPDGAGFQRLKLESA